MNSYDDNDVSQLRMRFFDLIEEPRRMLEPIEGFEEMPLVSLEEAVKPLVKEIPNIEQQALIAKQNCKAPLADGLSTDESASIRLYTMGCSPGTNQCLYRALNKTLRDANRNHLKKWFLYLKLIISSLRKIPSKTTELFRGVKLDLSEEHPRGQETIWWAFSSCTDSLELLEKPAFLGQTGVRSLFQIKCNSAKDIRQHSSYPKENELVLLPATMFKIIRNFDAGHGLHIIHLEETKSKVPLIDKGSVLLIEKEPVPLTEKGSVPNVSSVSTDEVKLTPKAKPPQATSSSFTDDLNYRNRDLENRIASFQPRSHVNLGGQQLTDRDMKIVVDQAIVYKQCKKLSLPNNEIKFQGILTLTDGIRQSTTLEELDLSNSRLSDEELSPLMKELSVNRTNTVVQRKCCRIVTVKELDLAPIKILNLSNNYIGDEGTSHLTEVLKVKRTLIQLNLSGNQISDKGVQLLAYVLFHRNSILQKLDLQNNQLITDSSVNYLIDMIRENRSLNTLWLTNCKFSSDSRQKLTDAVRSKRNFQLFIEP